MDSGKIEFGLRWKCPGLECLALSRTIADMHLPPSWIRIEESDRRKGGVALVIGGRAEIPIENGRAIVPNIAAHRLIGRGYETKRAPA